MRVMLDWLIGGLFKAHLIRFKDPYATGHAMGVRRGQYERERLERKVARTRIPDDAADLD